MRAEFPLITTIAALLLRELAAIRRSVEAYPDDAAPWVQHPGLPNAGGTLVLHVTGNLQHYFGAMLGGSAYVRDRPAEFARRDVPRATLLEEVAAAERAVRLGSGRVTPPSLHEPFPEPVGGRELLLGDFLAHIVSHTAYHLGQLDYHRRVTTGDARGVGAVAAADLPRRESSPQTEPTG